MHAGMHRRLYAAVRARFMRAGMPRCLRDHKRNGPRNYGHRPYRITRRTAPMLRPRTVPLQRRGTMKGAGPPSSSNGRGCGSSSGRIWPLTHASQRKWRGRAAGPLVIGWHSGSGSGVADTGINQQGRLMVARGQGRGSAVRVGRRAACTRRTRRAGAGFQHAWNYAATSPINHCMVRARRPEGWYRCMRQDRPRHPHSSPVVPV